MEFVAANVDRRKENTRKVVMATSNKVLDLLTLKFGPRSVTGSFASFFPLVLERKNNQRNTNRKPLQITRHWWQQAILFLPS